MLLSYFPSLTREGNAIEKILYTEIRTGDPAPVVIMDKMDSASIRREMYFTTYC